jgi:hypothetical protein
VCVKAYKRLMHLHWVLDGRRALSSATKTFKAALKNAKARYPGSTKESGAFGLSSQGRVGALRAPQDPLVPLPNPRWARSPLYQGWFGAFLSLILDRGTSDHYLNPTVTVWHVPLAGGNRQRSSSDRQGTGQLLALSKRVTSTTKGLTWEISRFGAVDHVRRGLLRTSDVRSSKNFA